MNSNGSNDRVFGPSRHLPNFFLLGAMRAGTASLTYYLQQHPSICFTEPRDPYFFQYDHLYQQGIDHYIRSFCRRFQHYEWRGEASPSYFARPHQIGPRLRAHYGDEPLKFIVLLREPVARAWSHYLYRVGQGEEKRDFVTALAEEREAGATKTHAMNSAHDNQVRYYAEGCYAYLLQEWQTYYPLENFLLLLSEDLAADPLAQVQRVFTWLGVDATVAVNVDGRLNTTRFVSGPSMRLWQDVPAWLRTLGKRLWPTRSRQTPGDLEDNSEHSNHSDNSFPGSFEQLSSLDPVVASELRKSYQTEILALSKLLGRYLSHWLLDDEELLEKASPHTSTLDTEN